MRKLFALIILVFAIPAFGATCKIDELKTIRSDTDGRDIPVGNYAQSGGTSVTSQNITYTTSTQSAAFGAGVQFIRVVCDARAHFVIGSNPTSAATNSYVPADTPEYFGVEAGLKIAFYDGSS